MTKNERPRRSRSQQRRIRLHFLGAAQAVTGSLHFFEYSDGNKTTRFFIDAGLNQEIPSFNFQNRLPAGLKATDVDFGIFSHTHIDHIGFLPRLTKDGFKGTVYATQATRDLCSVLLPDSGYLQEEQARRAARRLGVRTVPGRVAKESPRETVAVTASGAAKRLRKERNPRPVTVTAETEVREPLDATAALSVQPLYTEQDAVESLRQIQGVEFDKLVQIADGIAVRFTNASHLLGAAVVTLELGTGSTKRRIVFSGDLGRQNRPFLQDLEPVRHADYIICESTYGNKVHETRDVLTALADIINPAYERALKGNAKHGKGVILIPAFAVGRVQEVLFYLRQLMAEKRIPEIPVYVDSPMAIRATHIHREHSELYNRKAMSLYERGTDLFRTPRYAEVTDWQESEKLDGAHKEPIIVIGSSGMASGGRIMRHLEKRLPQPQNTVIFVGYQGLGTTGRVLTEPNVRTVKIGGVTVPIYATIEQMTDLSGHADVEDMISWLRQFQCKPKRLFLVHGDIGALTAFKTEVEKRLYWDVTIPRYREIIDLD